MRVSIITLHRVFNYGSVLQTYATQKMFEKAGFDAEIIDYIPLSWQTGSLLRNAEKKSNAVKTCIYRFFRFFSILLKELTFWGFLKRNIRMTGKYRSIAELKNAPPDADVYCTGSDQVWNKKYCGIDKAFYLRFGDASIPKIAYSASFGATELEDGEKDVVKEYLNDYRLISVREDSAVKILEDMGMDGQVLIDPTLQISAAEWREIAAPKMIKRPYLLLMLLYNEDNNATSIARRIADEKKLGLVKLSWDMIKPKTVDRLMTHRTPREFLSLFCNADYVVTNSFHGLAFSINFNRQFTVIKRNEFNSRIESLLRLTGLCERLTDMDVDMNIVNKKIDYTQVNGILESEREKAADFLQAIKGIGV